MSPVNFIGLSFAASGSLAPEALGLNYNYWLVLCSFLVAWMGAYAGLTIVISIQSSVTGFARAAWLFAGSVTLGCAVWSMHYIGMLAFTLPVPTHHHVGLTLVSIVPAILASLIALLQLSKKQQSWKSTLVSGLFLGVGIGTMHYVGMAAMFGAFTLVYDPWIFALSIVTAIVLAIISLLSRNLSLRLSQSATLNRLFISAPIMGLAITGMHYTGMQAAIFVSDPGAAPLLHGLDHSILTIIVIALTVGLSLTAMISTSINGMFVRLQKAAQEAEAASQAKANFLARMSHEIRTPMTAVTGMAQLALRTDVTPRQADYLNKINTASQDLLGIINDILDFSKIEAGKFHLDQNEFSVEGVRKNIYTLFEQKAKEKDLQLSVHIEKNVPATLYGDCLRLNQILTNLVANAIKFTERGVVTVTIDAEETDSHDIVLTCSVRDSGIGMTHEQMRYIFDLFNQADSTITRQYGGTGLGLAVCKQLCELMHGRIWVESAPNLGTIFHFNLQMKKASSHLDTTLPDTLSEPCTGANAQPVKDRAREKPASQADILTSISGARVLLAEDNAFNQQIATEILKSIGVTVDLACDGHECLSKLEQHNYDLVLMDVQMPNMDGLSAAREIRKRWPDLSLPIIAITAHALPEDKAKSLQAGMDQHITKPFDPDELTTSIYHWLQVSGAASAEGLSEQHFDDNDQATRKMLISFCDVYHPEKKSLRHLLAEQDFEGAASLAHGIKSAAVYLNNTALSQHAAQVELCLRQSELPERELINRFDEELQLTWHATKRRLALLESSGAPTQPDAAAKTEKNISDPVAPGLRSLWNKLIQQLTEDDHQSEATAKELLSLLNESDQSTGSQLMQAIADTDYERALVEVDNLRPGLAQEDTPQNVPD